LSFSKTHIYWFILLYIGILIAFLLNLSTGSVPIPFFELIDSFFNPESVEKSHYLILQEYRLPKAITALLVGSGLGVAGLLMQTFFRNPLAGPYVLGLSSGASLGVALLILGSSTFNGLQFLSQYKWSYAICASIGCLLVLSSVIIISTRVRNTNSILIVGLMFSSITSAIVSILSFFASQSELQQYVFWGFGSLGNLSWEELRWFASIYCIGIGLGLFSIKARNRTIIIIATSLLTGVVTAFSGPIAFIGLAIPYLAKQLFNSSNHKIIFPAVIGIGSIVMLLCDRELLIFKNETRNYYIYQRISYWIF